MFDNDIQVGDLNEDFIGQNLEKQSWLSTKIFQSRKRLYNCKCLSV